MGSSNWKTPEIYGSSEKVILFSRLERFEWISNIYLSTSDRVTFLLLDYVIYLPERDGRTRNNRMRLCLE